MEVRKLARESHAPGIGSGSSAGDPVAPRSKRQVMWSRAAHVAIIGIFLVVAITGLDLAHTILVPVVSAVVIGLMLGPLTSRASRLGVPTVVTAIVLLLLVIVVFNTLILLLSAPAIDWIGKGPDIGRTLKEKLQFFDRPLAALQDLRNAFSPHPQDGTLKVDVVSPGLIQPVMAVLTPALGELLIFFGTLFFFIAARPKLRQSLVTKLDGRDTRLRALRILNDIETSLTHYLSVVAVINLAVGCFAALAAYVIGLPSPLAWGVLGFILNFIPYVGALMMEAALFAVGLVTFPTLGQAVIAPLVYLAFSVLEGHFITPTIIGRQFTMTPILVFLSLVFWTWLWGPVGALLAVPLLIVALVAVGHMFPKDEPSIP